MDKRYQVIALMGKAGAGKDTIQSATCHKHPELFNKIISCTTRPPRDNEKNGKDYHFLSVIDFTHKVLNGDMLEATEFRDWFYGTSIDSLVEDKINIGVFNPAGVEALLQTPNISVLVIYVDVDDKTRLMRYLQRSEHPDCAEMCRRYFADEKDFADLDFEYVTISNDNGENMDLLSKKDLVNTIYTMWYHTGQPLYLMDSARKTIKAKSAKNEVKND